MKNDRRKGVVLSYISLVASVLLSLIYTPFLLEKLGQSEYGLYSLVNTVMSYLTLLDHGLGNTIVRFSAKYRQIGNKEKESSLYGMFVILYTIIGTIALVAGLTIAFNANTIFANSLEPGQENKIFIMIIIAVINVAISFPLSISSCIIQGYERYFYLNFLGLIQKLLTPFTMIGILLAGYGSIGILLTTAIISTLFNILRIWYSYNNLHISIRFKGFESKVFKEITTFSLFTFVAAIADKLFWSIDQVLLGILGKMGDIASYALSSVFISAFISITSVIGHMYLPKFTKMVTRGDSDNDINIEFIKVSRLQFYICMLIFGGFLTVGYRFITELYASPEYHISYYIVALIMGSLAIGITQNVALSVLYAKNMHKIRTLIKIAVALLNVIFTIIAIRIWGAIGAALMSFLTHILGTTLLSIYYQKKVKLSITGLWKQLLKPLLKYIILIVVFLALNKFVGNKLTIYPYFFSFGFAYVITYIAITYFTCMNKYEKGVIDNFATKISKLIRR